MQESVIESQLVRAVEKIGGLAPKWVSPGNRGVPDRLIILPNGTVAFVEMKSRRGRLEPLQAWWAKRLRKLGHRVYTIDSEGDIARFIQEVNPK